MIFYLDNSVIDRIAKDGLVAQAYRWIRTEGHRVVVSDLNFLEAGVGKIEKRREQRLRCLQELMSGDPLSLPSVICKRAMGSVLYPPSLAAILSTTSIEDLEKAKDDEEAWFRRMLVDTRPEMQEAVAQVRASDPALWRRLDKSPAVLLRHYWQDKKLLSAALEAFHNAEGQDWPTGRDPNVFLLEKQPLMAYFAGIAVLIHWRDVRSTGYGNRNPGSIDVQQAIYMPSCDVLVTNDRTQREALRLVGKTLTPAKRVWPMERFFEALGVRATGS